MAIYDGDFEKAEEILKEAGPLIDTSFKLLIQMQKEFGVFSAK